MVIRPQPVRDGVALFPARTPTLLPATHTNSYALGREEVLLVEPATPYEDEQREWIAWAREIQSTRKIVGLFATHHHPDHVGGAALLARELGLPIWAHEATASRIDVPVARLVSDGEELMLGSDRWTAMHTPGHAPGHLCLLSADKKTVVVGDMVASVGTILIAPGDGDMTLYLQQLERLAGLNAEVALPAHGDPITTPTAVFERYVLHRRMREEKIFAVLGTHPDGATSEAITPAAYDDASPAVWPWAKLSIDAHFEKLEREGRITRSSERADVFRVVK